MSTEPDHENEFHVAYATPVRPVGCAAIATNLDFLNSTLVDAYWRYFEANGVGLSEQAG